MNLNGADPFIGQVTRTGTLLMDTKPKILHADEVIPPDPLADERFKAACLPDDADDDSDAGLPTTSHENEGWRSAPIYKP